MDQQLWPFSNAAEPGESPFGSAGNSSTSWMPPDFEFETQGTERST